MAEEVPVGKKYYGVQCFAYGCYNYKNLQSREAGITFHKFPNKDKYPDLYSQWIQNCRRVREPSKHSKVCSRHFEACWLNKTLDVTVLKEGAIPTVFTENLPKYLQSSKPNLRTTSNSSKSCERDDVKKIGCVTSNHTYVAHDGEEVLKRKIKELEEKNLQLKKQLRNSCLREKRSKMTCKVLINDLKQQNLVTSELEIKLATFEEIPCDLFRRASHEYTQEQKDFAVTLHLYSPKAYSYLKRESGLALPDPRTLRRWLENVGASPGINVSMLSALKEKLIENPADYSNCCLLLDAMAIRQKVEYDSRNQQFSGFVDLGHGPDESSEAKEALVFMIVGLKGRWKAPVAYFLTRGLSSKVQAQLLSDCIYQVEDIGMHVRAITLGGHATNMGMLRLLGCVLNLLSMRSYFGLPEINHKIYVIMDACHMIKLVRNLLHSSSLLSSDGTIQWNYVSKLHKFQQQLGLRLGNKLKSDHIEFQSKKMKVSLAVQVLSNSVASALQTLKDLGLPEFVGSGPTIEFLKKIDRLFDVLNSRSLFGVGDKCAISHSNWPTVFSFFQDMTIYLTLLRTVDGTPLHKTRRSTCIIGLITNMSSIEGLIQDLVPANIQYLSTYKLSQDHLELFFSAVRGCGGWNNNPTAKGFESIMKRLLTRAGASMEPSTSNVRRIDETDVVRVSTTSYVPCYKIGPSETLQNPPTLTSGIDIVQENILVYVAGWVVRKASSHIHCQVCKPLLLGNRLLLFSNFYSTFANIHSLIH